MNRQPASHKPGFTRLAQLCALAFGLGFGPIAPVAAQSNLFEPVLVINDRVISRFEFEQRLLFLQLLRQPGDLEAEAMKGLTEDRLRMWAAKQYGVKVTPDALKAGIEEFAGRANLTGEKFIEALGQGGVQAQTFRDFVEAGLVWRDLVRGKYGASVSISEADIDRALANYVPTSTLTVQVSEISIAASGAGRSAALALARRLKAELDKGGDFAAAARANSSGPSAGAGGKLAPMSLSSLPEAAVGNVRRLAPGQVSEPIVLADRVVLYQMQSLKEDPLKGPAATVVDYAQFLLPAGEDVAQLRKSVDTCNDLYALAKGLPADRLLRESHPDAQVPGDLAAALRLLDPGESTTLSRGGWTVFLMLCSRGAAAELMPTREQARIQLTNQRLAAKAEIYMEELRSEAIIRQP